MDSTTLMQKMKDFIIDTFLFGDEQGLDEHTRLFESGMVDSTGILEIVSFLQSELGVAVEDEDITAANFSTIDAISRFISKKPQ